MSCSGALALLLALLIALAPTVAGAQGSAPSDDTSNDSSDTTAGPPTSLDPCQLVTSAEASQIANTTLGAGVEQDNEGGSRTCVYGYQTLNVFMVTVAQAADAASASAAWSQYQAQAQSLLQNNLPPGANITVNLSDTAAVSGFDQAALGTGTLPLQGHTINFGGIYLLHGATFVTYSDLLVDNPPPSSASLESEAQLVLTRLP